MQDISYVVLNVIIRIIIINLECYRDKFYKRKYKHKLFTHLTLNWIAYEFIPFYLYYKI